MHITSCFLLAFSFNILSTQAKKRNRKQKIETSENENFTQYIFLSLGAIILFVLLIILLKRRARLLRAQKLKSLKSALEVKQLTRKDKPCTMTQMQKDQAIDWFSKQNWILEQTLRKDKSTKNQLQLISVKRKAQSVDGEKYLKDYYDAFYVQMRGKGSSCDVFGVIMFEKFYMTLIFQKSEHNSKNSKGIYEYKFFDGVAKKGSFQGKWYKSDDFNIQAERQYLRQKLKNNQQGGSEKSFSKTEKQSDQGYPLGKSKQQRGSFKLYHK